VREYRPRSSGGPFYSSGTVFVNIDDCINKALGAKLSYKSWSFKRHSMHVTEIGESNYSSAIRKPKEGFETSKYIFQKSLSYCTSKELD
jgi:hypothetical protein